VHGAHKTIIQQRLPKEVDAELHLMEVLAELMIEIPSDKEFIG
jgi:hypothetical protein